MKNIDLPTQSYYYWLPPVSMVERVPLEKSGTYAACEQMIQMPFMAMRLSKLDEMLTRLEKMGRLSISEHHALLELAQKTWRVNA